MDIEALEKQEIKKKQRLVAGLFVLAILLTMIFAYWMGAFGFGPSRHIYVTYSFAGGLERGSTVRLAGIKVGRVTEIEFVGTADPKNETPDPTASLGEGRVAPANLRLKLEINRDAFKQVTKDSSFYVNLAGLIGERYVEVVPGSAERVRGGDTLRGIDPPRVDQLLSQGYGIFGDLRAFFAENKGDLKEMFYTLNDFAKNLSQLLRSVSPEQRKQIGTLLANLASMSADLKSLAASVNGASEHLKNNGGKESWESLHKLLVKANKIEVDDLRRLMLEDGVRVRFGKGDVPALPPAGASK